jgi:hypothetical protein
MSAWTRGLLSITLALAWNAASAQGLPKVGTPISEAYRHKFEVCDATDTFDGVHFPILDAAGKIRWYQCKSDPSRFTRFERIAPAGEAPAAVIIVSKLAHDRDGSPSACSIPGKTDNCSTSLMLLPTQAHPCPEVLKKDPDYKPKCLPVDASQIPYVAIPQAAPAGINKKEFGDLSGLAMGDVGVVIANGKTIPVIIADGGPAYKIGEGSTALLAALSSDGKPRTIAGKVTLVLFPKSGFGSGISPDTLKADVEKRAIALFAQLPK